MDKIIFVGTLPVMPNPENVHDSINECCWLKIGYTTSPSFSVFEDVKAFLRTYDGEYYFLHYGPVGTHCFNFDPEYDTHSLITDLRKPIPEEISKKMQNSSIIYIDTNTLGFIDHRKSADEWIDLFTPYLSDKGYLVIDDDIERNFPRRIDNDINTPYLFDRIYNGYTSKILSRKTMNTNRSDLLYRFLPICKQTYPTVVFKLDDFPNKCDIKITKSMCIAESSKFEHKQDLNILDKIFSQKCDDPSMYESFIKYIHD